MTKALKKRKKKLNKRIKKVRGGYDSGNVENYVDDPNFKGEDYYNEQGANQSQNRN